MKRNKTLKTARDIALTLLALASVLMPVVSSADSQAAAPDISQWKCKYCLFEEPGLSGEVEVGPGYTSEDSYKFGEYSGLNQQGGFLIGNAQARYRGEDAAYLNLSASELGLDSRAVGIEGGRQGRYKLFLKYDELPHYISDSTATPFLGAGSDSLSLPPGWVSAGTTSGMTGLNNSLHDVDLDTKRKRLDLGAALIPFTRWEYAANFRHETKEGTKATAGSFFFNAAQLIQPVDYTTDEVDLSFAYNGEKLQTKLAYYGSSFKNSDASLTWENPFDPLVPVNDVVLGDALQRGQLAQPPDNQFHQLVLSSGYQITDQTRAMADIAVGRMTQDENFLSVTRNSLLGAPDPSRNSLDGQVDTLTANLKVVSAVTDKLRLNGAYTYNDRDNETPRAAYHWVTTDTYLNPQTRTNQPYSFTRSLLNLSADYRLPKKAKLGAGFDYDIFKRNLQDIDRTNEDTLWGKLSTPAGERTNLMFKFARANRDVSAYNANLEIDPSQNPLMRKYNMADRERDTVGFHTDITPNEWINIGAGIDYAWDNYLKSELGLQEGTQGNVSGDLSTLTNKKKPASISLSILNESNRRWRKARLSPRRIGLPKM